MVFRIWLCLWLLIFIWHLPGCGQSGVSEPDPGPVRAEKSVESNSDRAGTGPGGQPGNPPANGGEAGADPGFTAPARSGSMTEEEVTAQAGDPAVGEEVADSGPGLDEGDRESGAVSDDQAAGPAETP